MAIPIDPNAAAYGHHACPSCGDTGFGNAASEQAHVHDMDYPTWTAGDCESCGRLLGAFWPTADALPAVVVGVSYEEQRATPGASLADFERVTAKLDRLMALHAAGGDVYCAPGVVTATPSTPSRVPSCMSQ